tara:strand:- start:216 stop:881 length:666 start_codon:yes stop_codon:yes gene_type:complete
MTYSKQDKHHPYMQEQDDIIDQMEKRMSNPVTSINATEYAAANEFDDTSRRLNVEVTAADAYQRHCDKGVSPDELAEAIAIIAASFYEAGTSHEDHNGLVTTTNDLDFQQKSALGNLCNNSNWMMDGAADRITKLFTQMDQLEATFRGSDNEVYSLNRVATDIERLKGVQIPTLREYGAIIKAAYLGIRGEQWRPYVKAGTSPKVQSKNALLERVRKLRES